MSTWVHPSIEPDALRKAEDESLKQELDWLLNSLQASFVSLKDGLEECVELLAPKEPGSTLVLSSQRSESVKGFVTRVGTNVVRGDIDLRLVTVPPNTQGTRSNSTPSYHLSLRPAVDTVDLVLPQLQSTRRLINDSLDVIDVSRWGGHSDDASFISGQLKLLHDHLEGAKSCLKGPLTGTQTAEDVQGTNWTLDSAGSELFEPNLPPTLSLHFSVQDANLVLTVRTVAPTSPGGTPNSTDSGFSLTGFNLRNRLLGLGPRAPNHDEVGEVFEWHGKQDVTVREKVRVETGDPSLMSVAAKLSALAHEVARWRLNLRIVMGGIEDDDD